VEALVSCNTTPGTFGQRKFFRRNVVPLTCNWSVQQIGLFLQAQSQERMKLRWRWRACRNDLLD
jgi:hypothetical protein